VIATLNLNGDYLSDALAAQVGGIGIAPAATSTTTRATRSSRPPTARHPSTPTGQGQPGASVVLSGCLMLRYLGWTEAADAIEAAIEKTIAQKRVTYDFARQMEGATESEVLAVRVRHHREPVIPAVSGRRENS